jgi:hypothetical protein
VSGPSASLYWNDHPLGSAPDDWTALALPDGAGAPNRPVGIASGIGTATCSGGGGGNQPMDLLVAVAHSGLWRFSGCNGDSDLAGDWQPITSTPMDFLCDGGGDASDIKIPVVWPEPGSNSTYGDVLDRCTFNVYRVNLGTDAIDNTISSSITASKTTGFMAAQPGTDTLWVAKGDQFGTVARVANANSGSPDPTSWLVDDYFHNTDWYPDREVLGPIAVTPDGHAYVVAVDTTPPDPGQSRTTVGIFELDGGDPTFVGNLALPGAAVQAQDMAASCPTEGGTGHLYIATQGDGVIDVTISDC